MLMNTKEISRVNTLLRKERLLRGWSQQDLANHLGITNVTVNRWERGVQQPGPMFRLKLCQLFEKSEDALGLGCEEARIGIVSPVKLCQLFEKSEDASCLGCEEARIGIVSPGMSEPGNVEECASSFEAPVRVEAVDVSLALIRQRSLKNPPPFLLHRLFEATTCVLLLASLIWLLRWSFALFVQRAIPTRNGHSRTSSWQKQPQKRPHSKIATGPGDKPRNQDRFLP